MEDEILRGVGVGVGWDKMNVEGEGGEGGASNMGPRRSKKLIYKIK